MSRHLSEDQIARCIAGQAADAELQHSRECSECGAELNRFAKSMSLFHGAVREQVDHRLALRPVVVVSKRYGAAMRQRWVLVVAAAIVLIVLPFIRTGSKLEEFPEPISAESNPDEVMNRVNLHLARSVPAPMEPLLLGLPGESIIESGEHE